MIPSMCRWSRSSLGWEVIRESITQPPLLSLSSRRWTSCDLYLLFRMSTGILKDEIKVVVNVLEQIVRRIRRCTRRVARTQEMAGSATRRFCPKFLLLQPYSNLLMFRWPSVAATFTGVRSAAMRSLDLPGGWCCRWRYPDVKKRIKKWIWKNTKRGVFQNKSCKLLQMNLADCTDNTWASCFQVLFTYPPPFWITLS